MVGLVFGICLIFVEVHGKFARTFNYHQPQPALLLTREAWISSLLLLLRSLYVLFVSLNEDMKTPQVKVNV